MRVPNDKKRPNSNSGSLGQFLRNRGVLFIGDSNGKPKRASIMESLRGMGRTINTGRNAAKRAARVGPRKSWRVV